MKIVGMQGKLVRLGGMDTVKRGWVMKQGWLIELDGMIRDGMKGS